MDFVSNYIIWLKPVVLTETSSAHTAQLVSDRKSPTIIHSICPGTLFKADFTRDLHISKIRYVEKPLDYLGMVGKFRTDTVIVWNLKPEFFENTVLNLIGPLVVDKKAGGKL